MKKTDWLLQRKKGIGGSDAAAVLGMSKWKTPYQVWREKVYGEQQPDNGQFERVRECYVMRYYYDWRCVLTYYPDDKTDYYKAVDIMRAMARMYKEGNNG